MKERFFDVIVIGAGSGLTISSEAIKRNLKVAIVEKSKFGGTCLNRGCIPSKMLIYCAEVAETIKNAKLFGINAKIKSINWNKIQQRVWNEVDPEAKQIEESNKKSKNVTIFKENAEFVDFKKLKVGDEIITAEKIFICAGARPVVPTIKGLNDVPYITSDDALRLKKQPKKLIILGGGYIGAELGHFFSSLGTKVTIIDRGDKLLKNEDQEIAEAFTEIVSRKYNVVLNASVLEVMFKNKKIKVIIEQNKKIKNIYADTLLVATGRIPNTDILAVEKTDVKVNEKGFIEVNEFMETNVPGIWAIGDIAGKWMFKHSANLEAAYCAYNTFYPKSKIKVDYLAMPHAIFTSPQIAGVGATEQELKKNNVDYAVGTYYYNQTGMGKAIEENDGFVKVLVDKKTQKILGCHIIGTEASTLIHEVIVVMKAGLTVSAITKAVHIHPALSEVVLRACNGVQ